MDDKKRVFIEKLEYWYPEHKVYAFDSIASKLREAVSKYAKENGTTVDQLLSELGFEVIKGEEVYALRGPAKYKPGEEPDQIKNKVESILKRLGEAYQDKEIKDSLQKEHKNVYKDISGVAQWLGFKGPQEFLQTYGYKTLNNSKGGRPSTTDYDAVIASLKTKYSNGPVFDKLSDLINDNPELEGAINNMSSKSKYAYGMPLSKYFQLQGILFDAEYEKRRKRETVLKALKKKYADGPVFYRLIDLVYDNMKLPVDECHFTVQELIDEGLLLVKEKKEEIKKSEKSEIKIQPLTEEEKFEIVKNKLEAYYPEHKVYYLHDLDSSLGRMCCQIAKNKGMRTDEFVKSLGYAYVADNSSDGSLSFFEQIHSMRKSKKCNPGDEPEIIKDSLESVLYALEEEFPDKIVYSSDRPVVKNIFKRLNPVWMWLGYGKTREFLKAYGFIYVCKGDFPEEALNEAENQFICNLQLDKIDLPKIKENKTFRTVNHPGYFDNTFANTVFRGYKVQIEKAKFYLQSLIKGYEYPEKIVIYETDNPEIYEFIYRNSERDDCVDKVMRKFPELKVMAFFEDWKFKYADAYVVYSAPGYEYVTDYAYVGYVDYKQDEVWTMDCNPCERFTFSFHHYSTGDIIRIDYIFPLKKEWDLYNYLIRKEDGFYIKNEDEKNNSMNKSNVLKEKKTFDFGEYSIEGGNEAWDALLRTYEESLPKFNYVPFYDELIASPDLIWFEYSNRIIDELVKKHNYTNQHFKYNFIDCYDEILFNRKIAETWFERKDKNDPNVMNPFPYYGVDDIEDFTKSLISLLIMTGEPNVSFKKEIIERIDEISKAFSKIEAGFVKNILEKEEEYNEKILVKYDGSLYKVSKFIFEGGY